MPSTQKTLMFLSSSFTSFGAFVVICAIMAAQEWVSSSIAISDSSSNGTIVVTYGLFRGQSKQVLEHGLGETDKYFEVLKKLDGSAPKALHAVAILLLALSLCASLLSCGFSFYNSVSNPYQTFLGPLGLYTWNGLCASFTVLTMALFAGNVQANHPAEEVVQELYPRYPPATHRGTSHSYGYPFWLMLLVILLNIVTAVIVLFYQKARYKRKQEQRKPVEFAPRDGILF